MTRIRVWWRRWLWKRAEVRDENSRRGVWKGWPL